MIQINFDEITILGVTFRLGFQIQGKTFKINIVHKDYADSKPEDIGEKLITVFKDKFLNFNGYNTFNEPRKKAYISASRIISVKTMK